MEPEVFLLDWDRDILFGYQPYVCREIIASMRTGIRLYNDTFPPVILEHFYNPLTKRWQDTTSLSVEEDSPPFDPSVGCIYRISHTFLSQKSTAPDGGHHRALAHFLERKPLLCRSFSSSDISFIQDRSKLRWRLIHEVPQLTDVRTGDGESEAAFRMNVHGFYRENELSFS